MIFITHFFLLSAIQGFDIDDELAVLQREAQIAHITKSILDQSLPSLSMLDWLHKTRKNSPIDLLSLHLLEVFDFLSHVLVFSYYYWFVNSSCLNTGPVRTYT